MVHQKPLNINTVAEKFDMSRQGVSLHIKILTNCGLITINKTGRERYCEAKLDGLNEVAAWIDQYKQYWENKLDSMENYLLKIQKEKTNKKRKK
jgi:DNA-binding transcriptional ArsR family regulator